MSVLIRPLFANVVLVGCGILCLLFVLLLMLDGWLQRRAVQREREFKFATSHPLVPRQGTFSVFRGRYVLLALAGLVAVAVVRKNDAKENPPATPPVSSASAATASSNVMENTALAAKLSAAIMGPDFKFDYNHAVRGDQGRLDALIESVLLDQPNGLPAPARFRASSTGYFFTNAIVESGDEQPLAGDDDDLAPLLHPLSSHLQYKR